MSANSIVKKTTFLLPVLVAGASLFVSSVLAAEYKVGFVNVTKVLEKAPQAEDARGRIEREFAPKDRELVAQQKEIRRLEDKLVRDGAVMGEAERTKLDREIRSLKREVRRMQDEFREDLNLRRNQELSRLQRKVLDAVQTLAKSQKYDLIVSDGVLYAGERVDITDKVISRLQSEFKGSEKGR